MTLSPDPAARTTWAAWEPGLRVVVRRRLALTETTPAGPRVTDVIGVVVAAGAEGLTLRRDAARPDAPNDQVIIRSEDIVAGKPIPPRPARRAPRRAQ